MYDVHVTVPLGWLVAVQYYGKPIIEHRNCSRVFTNGLGKLCLVIGHPDVGMHIERYDVKGLADLIIRPDWSENAK